MMVVTRAVTYGVPRRYHMCRHICRLSQVPSHMFRVGYNTCRHICSAPVITHPVTCFAPVIARVFTYVITSTCSTPATTRAVTYAGYRPCCHVFRAGYHTCRHMFRAGYHTCLTYVPRPLSHVLLQSVPKPTTTNTNLLSKIE
eukprot:Rmarinus@m.14351